METLKVFGKWVAVMTAFAGLITLVVGGVSFFPSVSDMENRVRPIENQIAVVAAQADQNSEDLKYQSALRQLEYLTKMLFKDKEDVDTKLQLEEARKRVKAMECRMWGGEDCPRKGQ